CAVCAVCPVHVRRVFFFKQKTAYEVGLGIPAEPLFRSMATCRRVKLLRRITRTENILHRNFTRRQVAIQNRVASNIGISQSTFRSEERRVGKECRCRWWPY